MPSLRETVWLGLSAGSMVMPPYREDFAGWKPPTGGDSTLEIVGFSIFPHLDHVTDGTVDVVSEGHWKLFSA